MSDDSKPILVLDPKTELHFKGPFTEVVTSHLKLINPSDRRICFKVKTTAPKRYCVRPNNGIVEPKSTSLIAVMLQPFDIENQSDRNKHKFMVQTMFVPDGDINQDALWREATPDSIHDSKLKCVFDITTTTRPGSGIGGDRAGINNGVSSSGEVPPPQQQAGPVPVQPSSPLQQQQSNNLTATPSSWNNSAPTAGATPVTGGSNVSFASTSSFANSGRGRDMNIVPISTPPLTQTQTLFNTCSDIKVGSKVGSSSAGNDSGEVRSLREEISRLRTENMHLKEEGLRQRIRSGESSGGSGSRTSTADLLKSRSSMNSGNQQQQQQDVVQLLMNPNVLAIGLVLFVIGIVLGKVVF